MKKIAVIDCETDPFEYGAEINPFIWGFYDGETYFETESTTEFAEYIAGFKGTIYAHNGGKFDYFFLLPFAEKGQRCKIINGRLSEFKIGKATCRDSINILPLALAKFQKDEFDYWKMAKDQRRFYMDEIRRYLKSDCVNLYEIVSRFISEYSYSLTLAGAAVKEYKKLGGELIQTSEEFYNNFSPWYFGGRVSCFESGVLDGDFKIYDINSAYPTMMRQKHPHGARYWTAKRCLDRHLPLAFLDVTCDSYGALPLRDKTGGVSFPEMRGRFFCTGREFRAGVETGTIKNISVNEVRVFDQSVSFGDYVEHFYEKKLAAQRAGDKPGREMAKLFLNSLYGKFAANPNKYANHIMGEWGETPPDGYDIGALIGGVQFFEKPLDDPEKNWFNVATAASITGAVRAYLWESINKVSRPLYCDTDSIICADGSGLPLGESLGEWDLEGTADRVAIAGKKMYCAWLTNGKTKMATKGVRLKPDEILRVAKGKTVSYYSDAPTFSLKKGVYYTTRKVKPTIEV